MALSCPALFLAASFAFAGVSGELIPQHPNVEMSPSKLCTRNDPSYSRDRYAERIAYCARSVESALKDQIYDNYGVPQECRKDYIIDHIIPLSIGGSNDIENLWPEHHSIRDEVNPLEEEVFAEVSSGAVTQAEAVKRILQTKFNPDHVYEVNLHCH